MNKIIFLFTLGLAILFLPACSDTPEKAEVKKMKIKIAELRGQYAQYQRAITSADIDAGLKNVLKQKQALLKSRLERLVLQRAKKEAALK